MAKKAKKILFIMFDQLRFDYLSCYGHPHLDTPNIDRLASQGVRFTNCYVQSPICGSSRMSFYTGRYASSHGALWNGYPLKVGEMTIGDHLRTLGMDSYLIGKTHMRADVDGMTRLGIPPDSLIGARVAECGFDAYVRDDGLWPEGPDGFYDVLHSQYNEYLIEKGYDSENPWLDYANAGVDDKGEIASGWMMMHAGKPANIREEDSETPYMTSQCIKFIDEMKSTGDKPWLCHLSYIKPHWPYIAPEPYHSMYSAKDVIPVNRHENEKIDTHPVYEQFMNNVVGQAFRRDDVLEAVVPTYMGLIKQCDDQLGRLFAHLEASGRMDDTMIVITSDHGDNMGDHWLGEKDLFHEPSAKIPMIIYDPSSEADSTRGMVCDELTESIDLAATFYEAAGGEVKDNLDHILEGHSLLPLLHGHTTGPLREYAFSEYDYSVTPAAIKLDLNPRDAQLYMVTDKRWKFIFAEGFRPMLFDRQEDPQELVDLGTSESPEHIEVRSRLYEALSQWWRRVSQRTTKSENDLRNMRGKTRRRGIVLGLYDGSEAPAEITAKFRGKVSQRYTSED